MDSHEVLKTYAMFYVSENDEFDTKKKLDMLNFIEQADEEMLMDLFENNEIEAPLDLLESDPTDEVSDAQLIGESAILIEQATWLMEGDEYLAEDMKNRLKDLLGMETSLKYKIGKAAGSAKKALEKQLDKVQDQIGNLRDAIAKGAKKAVKAGGEALEKGKEMAGDAGEAISKGAKKAVKAGGEAVEKAKDVAGDVGEKISKGAGKAVETAKDVAGDVGEKVSGAAGKAAEYAQANPGMVGGAVAAAAALTAGVMAYRKFFSKAAQACKSAPDKNACMAQYKMKAKQAQISALNAGKAKCAKTKDPAKCKGKIDAKIAGLKAKMRG